MDVGLNSGQLALRDSVRDVLRTECPPAIARQAMTDPDRWRTVWKTVVDLGWSELAVPAADGDSSFGRMDLTVVLEECGAALAPVPLLSSVGLAAGLLACWPVPPSTMCWPRSAAAWWPHWPFTRRAIGCPRCR